MAAPVEVYLLAAIDDLPVREISSFFFITHFSPLFAIERQGDMQPGRHFQQFWQQPGIASHADDQIGVMALQNGTQVNEQRSFGLKPQVIFLPPRMNDQLGRRCVLRIAIRPQGKHAQGRRLGIQFPGRIQYLKAVQFTILFILHAAVRHAKRVVQSGIAQRELDISIVIFQIGEMFRHPAKQARLLGSILHADGQYRQTLFLKQVAPFLPPKV